MIDGGVTAGERLCNFLNHRLLKSDVWGDLEEILGVTGRSAHLVLFSRVGCGDAHRPNCDGRAISQRLLRNARRSGFSKGLY